MLSAINSGTTPAFARHFETGINAICVAVPSSITLTIALTLLLDDGANAINFDIGNLLA